MALTLEDKKDVKSAYGKALANKVSKATHDNFDQHAQTKKNNTLMIKMDRKRESNRLTSEARSKALDSKVTHDYPTIKIKSGKVHNSTASMDKKGC